MLLMPLMALSQTTVDHWETVIKEGSEWRYLVPDSEPPTDWTSLDFDVTSWKFGNSGFGYGDGDDNTVVSSSISVYIRKVFEIIDKSAIEKAVLYMDYDDGFVAYLNGTEIARDLVSGSPPDFNQNSDGLHEALIYQGITPEKFSFDTALLKEGENVLAVQVHNESLGSSDLTAIPVMLVGLNDTSSRYDNTPSWFDEPLQFTFSSLPITVINTQGSAIVDDPKVKATFGVIYNGEGAINQLSDAMNAYEGFCGIEVRGETSQSFAKKSYAVETWDSVGNDMDTSFLNFPSEEDFILYGPFSDKSLLNNALAMKLTNDMGHYASRTRFTELVINEDYKGVYLIMEKIKRDKNRVDIAKLGTDEISGDDLTGGYIFRIDKGNSSGWTSKYNVYNSSIKLPFQFFYPRPDSIRVEQKAYIKNYVDDFEDALASASFKNDKDKHYLKYIDLRSFVDNFILNELSKNVDGYRLSTYFHKDKDSKGGKITAGPSWDFNLSFGNADYCQADITNGFQYGVCEGTHPFWWSKMQKDTVFTNALRCRWEELRMNTLSISAMHQYLDTMAAYLGDAQVRNFKRWPIMGRYVWPNPSFYANSPSHGEVIGQMKKWIDDRVKWLDTNIPGIAQHCNQYENFTYDDKDPEIVTGLYHDMEKPAVTIYPNPTNGVINIRSASLVEQVWITDLLGKVIYKKTFKARIISIRLDEKVKNGTYLLSMTTTAGPVTKRVIIE